jgi:hypothetical protein
VGERRRREGAYPIVTEEGGDLVSVEVYIETIDGLDAPKALLKIADTHSNLARDVR